MTTTTVVNLHRDEFDVYIGRAGQGHSGMWGNPFTTGTKREQVEKYRQWILHQPYLLNQLEDLRGKRLGCFCAPYPCHGDVLVEMLEGFDNDPAELAVTYPTRFGPYVSGDKRLSFSNFNPTTPVTIDGVRYATAEHAYQSLKHPNDAVYQSLINESDDPAQARFRAKALKSRMPILTEGTLHSIMHTVQMHRIEQNPHFARQLRASGDAILQEAGPEPWGGDANWMGCILMELREQLPPEPAYIPDERPPVIVDEHHQSRNDRLDLTIADRYDTEWAMRIKDADPDDPMDAHLFNDQGHRESDRLDGDRMDWYEDPVYRKDRREDIFNTERTSRIKPPAEQQVIEQYDKPDPDRFLELAEITPPTEPLVAVYDPASVDTVVAHTLADQLQALGLNPDDQLSA